MVVTGEEITPSQAGGPGQGETELSSNTDGRVATTESSWEVEGGRGNSRREEVGSKTRRESTSRRVTEDGWEEEVYEEYEEEQVTSRATTTVTAAPGQPLPAPPAGLQARQTVETVSSSNASKVRDGRLVGVESSSERKGESKEIIIPIMVLMIL